MTGSPSKLMLSIYDLCNNKEERWMSVYAFYSKKTEPSMKVSKWIAWAIGWFKFYTDGASKRNLFLHSAATGHSGKSGAGGLLRDCSGTWICGYT